MSFPLTPPDDAPPELVDRFDAHEPETLRSIAVFFETGYRSDAVPRYAAEAYAELGCESHRSIAVYATGLAAYLDAVNGTDRARGTVEREGRAESDGPVESDEVAEPNQ